MLLIFVMCGCNNYVYRPVSVKPTYFTAKNDCEVSANIMTITRNPMGEYHGAYAITNHIALSGTYSTGSLHDTSSSRDSAGKLSTRTVTTSRMRDKELAVGYFTPLGGGNSFEVYTGMAFAHRNFDRAYSDFKNTANNTTTSGTSDKYTRFFIQPAFGRNGKYVDFGIANRFNFITYEATHHTDLISETSIMIRFGYKNVKFMTQMGFTIFDPDNKYHYHYYPFNIGFGFYILFNQQIKMPGIN